MSDAKAGTDGSRASEHLRAAATCHQASPERTALALLPDLRTEPRRFSYRQLVAHLHQTGNAFHRLGVRSGDAVALLTP